ncbi:hypothetical protein B566_EDAN017598 [Ephemera danica]|nr:hypothetical protein B566_EDAN017598 [Ephemera danica]
MNFIVELDDVLITTEVTVEHRLGFACIVYPDFLTWRGCHHWFEECHYPVVVGAPTCLPVSGVDFPGFASSFKLWVLFLFSPSVLTKFVFTTDGTTLVDMRLGGVSQLLKCHK